MLIEILLFKLGELIVAVFLNLVALAGSRIGSKEREGASCSSSFVSSAAGWLLL